MAANMSSEVCPQEPSVPCTPGPARYSLIDLVGEAPAVAGVAVAMARVDEAVLQGLADVLG